MFRVYTLGIVAAMTDMHTLWDITVMNKVRYAMGFLSTVYFVSRAYPHTPISAVANVTFPMPASIGFFNQAKKACNVMLGKFHRTSNKIAHKWLPEYIIKM